MTLQFWHHVPSEGFHQITAIDPARNAEVGWLGWRGDHESEHGPAGEITALGVASQYQHRGVAGQMYRLALAHSPVPVRHSAKRTRAGERWAERTGGPLPPLRPEGYLADMEPPPVRPLASEPAGQLVGDRDALDEREAALVSAQQAAIRRVSAARGLVSRARRSGDLAALRRAASRARAELEAFDSERLEFVEGMTQIHAARLTQIGALLAQADGGAGFDELEAG